MGKAARSARVGWQGGSHLLLQPSRAWAPHPGCGHAWHGGAAAAAAAAAPQQAVAQPVARTSSLRSRRATLDSVFRVHNGRGFGADRLLAAVASSDCVFLIEQQHYAAADSDRVAFPRERRACRAAWRPARGCAAPRLQYRVRAQSSSKRRARTQAAASGERGRRRKDCTAAQQLTRPSTQRFFT